MAVDILIASALSWATNYVFTPGGQTSEGPRLDNLGAQSASEGSFIKQTYGTVLISGTLIHMENDRGEYGQLIEERRSDTEGANFFSSGNTVISYHYYLRGLVGICEGEIQVNAIWANAVKIRDFTDRVSVAEIQAMEEAYPGAFDVLLPGSYEQAPPTIVETEGIAFRGTAIHSIPEMALDEFGSGPPSFRYEVSPSSAASEEMRLIHEFDNPIELNPTIKLDRIAPGQTAFRAHYGGAGSRTSVHFVYEFNLWETAISFATYSRDHTDAGFDTMFVMPIIGNPNFYLGGLIEDGPPQISKFDLQLGSRNSFSDPLNDITYDNYATNPPAQQPYPAFRPQYGWLPETGTMVWVGDDDRLATPRNRNLVLGDVANRDGNFFYDYEEDRLYHHSSSDSTLRLLTVTGDEDFLGDPVRIEDTWSIAEIADGDIRNGRLVLNDSANPGRNLIVVQLYKTEYDVDGTTVLNPAYHEELYNYQTSRAPGDPTSFPYDGARWLSDNLILTQGGVYRWRSVEPGETKLQEVLDDQMSKAGLDLTDYDNTALNAETVRGYTITELSSARENIQPLMQAFQFDVVESGYQLKTVPRGGPKTPVVIDVNHLRAGSSGSEPSNRVVTREADHTELPRRVNINYIQAETFEPGVQFAERSATRATRVVDVQLTLVMTDDEALQLADKLLREAWIRRFSHTFTTTIRYSYLEPTDIVTLPLGDAGTVDAMILSIEESGLLMTYTAESYETAAFSSDLVAAPAPPRPYFGPQVGGPTDLIAMDIPMLSAADDQHRLIMANGHYREAWRGTALYNADAIDGDFERVATLTTRSVVGTLTSPLAAPALYWMPDRANTVNIRLNNLNQTLLSVTEEALYAREDTNLAAVGENGRWEFIKFQTATLESDGTYTLSGLLRGLMGTEGNCGDNFAGDDFVLLDAALLDAQGMSAGVLDDTFYFKGVSLRSSEAAVAGTPVVEATYRGESFKPYAPAAVQFSDDGFRNITITWQRRARFGGEWADGGDVALELDCMPETYELDIYNASGGLVRTETVSAPAYTYSSGSQVADGVGGAPNFSVSIYQISQVVGRGNANEAIYP